MHWYEIILHLPFTYSVDAGRNVSLMDSSKAESES